jgi:hypothetical protein
MARQDFLERLADNHEIQIKKTLEDLEARIVSQISTVSEGADAVSTQIAIDLRTDLKRYIDETYRTTADTLVRDYDQIVNEFMEEFGGLDIPDKFKSLTKVDLLTINQLKFQQFAGFEDLAGRYLNEISSQVYQNAIAGKPFNEMVKDLRGLITGEVDRRGRPMSTYASQIAHDSVMQFDGQFTVYKSKEAGLDKFKYTGTLVGDSRPHCVTHLNKVYTEEQIRSIWQSSWAGKSEGDPFTVRGGYRCRHTWLPVADEFFDAEETQQEDKPFSLFGDVSDDERDLLKEGFGNTSSDISKVISLLPALKGMQSSGRGFYRSSDDVVNVGKSKSLETFVHEYGHRIDRQLAVLFKNNKNLDLWEKLAKNSKVVGTFYFKNLSKLRSIATLSADKVLKDSIILGKNLKQRKLSAYNERRTALVNAPDDDLAKASYYKKLNEKENVFLNDNEIKEYLALKKAKKSGGEAGMFEVTQREIYEFKLKLKYKVIGGDYGGYDMQFSDRFNDFMGAITKEAIGYGHGKGYYAKYPTILKSGQRTVTEGQTLESFAEYVTIKYSGNAKFRDYEFRLMEYFAPNTKAEYDFYFKEFNKL